MCCALEADDCCLGGGGLDAGDRSRVEVQLGQVALQVADPAERGRRLARLAVQHLVERGLALESPETVGFQVRLPLEPTNGRLGSRCLDTGDGACVEVE